ncbi:putative cyclohexanone monooxygenase [Lyophyllum shimeji]|uniref:Cyclohexanone monooxygenase n=1 Tax=Lyophyllum shimeji TaxID=47721 RepID=A0A9P3USH5_LYOSH|nr:putative cyclohexanone monooxygenase [Lyophyllum shimeji]
MSIDALPTHPEPELDVLVIGAGFSGLYQLYKLRKAGFLVKVLEAGSKLGGTWFWNCYPGARVDSEYSDYQFSMEELWKDWNWKERFPGREELVEYFEYVDKKLDLSRDISYNTRVTSTHFDTNADRWVTCTHNGRTVRSRFLLVCTGYSSKPLYPDIKGLDTFQGIIHHTARWPQGGVELAGKRIGVIGTGASGVQVIQESGPVASHLTVFQRTPNLALPMKQRKLDIPAQEQLKDELYQHIFRRREQTFAGYHFDGINRSLWDLTEEEKFISFEDLWSRGGFHFALGSYRDVQVDMRANEEAYKFWRMKVLKRLRDPEMQRKLAPEVAPHPFGIKRPSLEQRYYEVYNQSNVTLIDLNENNIVEVTPKGVKTQDGVEHELDVLVLATGFDAITGSIIQIDIQGTDGESIKEKWSRGLSTYLGLMSKGYPNMFFPYGPHGPTAFCNGPSCAELQGDWIVDCLAHMRKHGKTRIEPEQAAEDAWVAQVHEMFKMGPFLKAKTWYTGANVPGKRIEALNFVGGVPLYMRMVREAAKAGYKGFVLSGSLENVTSTSERVEVRQPLLGVEA